MKSASLRSALVIAAMFLTGCHESGTWQDDAGNWKRIFQVPKPDDVTVVHSYYWRSPHFTHEFEYFLQLRKYPDLEKRILTMNAMVEVTGEKSLRETTTWSASRPAWFAPKPITAYKVYSDSPNSDFRLLIDRETGDLFLSDLQL